MVSFEIDPDNHSYTMRNCIITDFISQNAQLDGIKVGFEQTNNQLRNRMAIK